MPNTASNNITGLLLAAGNSKRFGSPKCLYPLPNNEIPMGLQSALNLKQTIDRIICVTRTSDDELAKLFKNHHMPTIFCGDAEKGMSASLKAGVMASSESKGWLIALADMPLIKPSTYRLIANLVLDKNKIIVPVYNGKKGHPVGFPKRYYEKLVQLKGDQGAKSILIKHSKEIIRVEVDDPGIHIDFDTPQAVLMHNSLKHKQ